MWTGRRTFLLFKAWCSGAAARSSSTRHVRWWTISILSRGPPAETLSRRSAGFPMAPMLASRGCLFNCSFCSIRQFYGEAPGPHRRVRSPEDVAAEMRSLYDSRGVRLFLFQDDDFAAKTEPQRAWVERFLLALDAEGLTGKVGWKISCRVDDIEPEIMAHCRDHGLLAAYLGVESGNGEGLATLNKHATVEQNHQAMRTLRST